MLKWLTNKTIENLDLKILIRNAAKNESLAQKALFERFYGFILSITLRYMTNRSEAEEMLNDTFLKVFNHLQFYDEQYDFKAWIRKIAVNTCIDRLRKIKKKIEVVELDLNVHAQIAELFFELDQNKPILPVLQELPTQYRAVFNLYVFEEYKHREIADILGISIGTSKSNYSRAKMIVKKKLESQEKYKLIRIKTS